MSHLKLEKLLSGISECCHPVVEEVYIGKLSKAYFCSFKMTLSENLIYFSPKELNDSLRKLKIFSSEAFTASLQKLLSVIFECYCSQAWRDSFRNLEKLFFFPYTDIWQGLSPGPWQASLVKLQILLFGKKYFLHKSGKVFFKSLSSFSLEAWIYFPRNFEFMNLGQSPFQKTRKTYLKKLV